MIVIPRAVEDEIVENAVQKAIREKVVRKAIGREIGLGTLAEEILRTLNRLHFARQTKPMV